jgi:glutathione synthase/RimK-type ligase-like ATP-grasp enzyme
LSQTLLVVHNTKDCPSGYPGEHVITFTDYLAGRYPHTTPRNRIINLSRNFGYLSEGYYCSLLAESRGHKVIPSVSTLLDLSRRALYRMHVEELDPAVYRFLDQQNPEHPLVLRSFFGRTTDPQCADLARKLFDAFPCPILKITLKNRKRWQVTGLKLESPRDLSPEEATQFAKALEEFSRKVWRRKPDRKHSRYDLAVLCDPQEQMPPSNRGALKRFIRAGREMGIDAELITRRDYLRLAEFDGLFIRTTTNIDHYTFSFAKRAENEGLVVIDDSKSILRCTNKVYLADLFRTNRVPAPRTVLLQKDRPQQLHHAHEELGFPIVVKIPDGAFSRGVEKARDAAELKAICRKLFRESTLLLAQEFLYTDFDWRIGILDNRPLYACRYYMVKHHWQIYRHGSQTDSGGFESVSVSEVPPAVLEAALKATRPIGDGFYGVDVKERDGQGYVIEVNDNPSIDQGVEDKHPGMDLYREIMGTLLRRMEARRGR